MISFIIPAHNEEDWIGRSVAAVQAAAKEEGEDYEIIVVDDSSSDDTARIATEAGARVIRVEHRQIAATRNAGARESRGEILFFVDADTLANTEVVAAALAALRGGAVGGGCLIRFEGKLPLWAHLVYPFALAFGRWCRTIGGAFMFCTREAFNAAGGFSEEHFAAEELVFIRNLRKLGPVVIPRPTVITSGRKLRAFSLWQILRALWPLILRGPDAYRSREGLTVWYGERSPDPP